MNFKLILRDSAVILALTFIGGLIIGLIVFSSGKQIIMTDSSSMKLLGLSNYLFSIIGFCIAGMRSPKNRFEHLQMVALAFWLLSIINIFMSPITISQWVISIVPTFICMGIGGALSFIFVRKPSEKCSEPA